MVMEVVKFIPAELRLEIAQSVIEETGIRPLARRLDVNPKSVYKYKRGTSHPGDQVMSKILAILKKEDPEALQNYLGQLKEEFNSSFENAIEPGEYLGSGREESVESESGEPEEELVGQRSTDEGEEEGSVDQEPTETLSVNEIFEKIGVNTPFERMKAEKVLQALDEEGQRDIGELVNLTGLSESAVERYLEELVGSDIVDEIGVGKYNLVYELEG